MSTFSLSETFQNFVKVIENLYKEGGPAFHVTRNRVVYGISNVFGFKMLDHMFHILSLMYLNRNLQNLGTTIIVY